VKTGRSLPGRWAAQCGGETTAGEPGWSAVQCGGKATAGSRVGGGTVGGAARTGNEHIIHYNTPLLFKGARTTPRPRSIQDIYSSPEIILMASKYGQAAARDYGQQQL